MKSLYETLMQFIESEGYDCEVVDSGKAVRLTLTAAHGTFRAFFVVDDEVLELEVDSGLRFPPPRLPAMLEFAARANARLRVGCLDIDLDERGVCYRSAAIAPDGQLPIAALKILFDCCMQTMDNHYPGLCALAFGAVSPERALEQVERVEDGAEPGDGPDADAG